MHWDESVWILQQLKKLIESQTSDIEEYVQGQMEKTMLFFSSDTPPSSSVHTGDVWFVTEEQEETQSVSEENNQSQGEE